MEIVNLKTAITFHVDIQGRKVAFSTKAFIGERKMIHIPEARDHVPYEVCTILIEATQPWYDLDRLQTVTVLWSNVLSVQLYRK